MKQFEEQHEKLRASLEEAKAYRVEKTALAFIDCGEPTCSCSNDVSYLQSRIESISRDYYDLWGKLYDHMSNGHIPQITGAEKMAKALKALGLEGDFDVQKKVIYASDGSKQDSFVLTHTA